MKLLRWTRALLVAVLALVTLVASVTMAGLLPVAWAGDGLLALPPLTQRVTDLTGTLTVPQRAVLEEKLSAFEQKKGAQIAVLLAPTFQPESIEQFGIRLAEAWKIGRQGVDDGVILLIAKDDRQLRIEVGYGLEGALNDATAKRIISEVITPRFRAGDYFGGIDAGVTAIQTVIEGESLPPPSARSSPSRGGQLEGGLLPLLAGAAFFAPLLNRLLGLGGSLLAAGIGVLIGGWLLGSWLIGLTFGAFVLFFSFMRGGSGIGGMGSGSGGFGSGGFSGGGGGFGGGGASGRW
ncbi:MAG: YgcG family protein [Rugosibacter sp.]|nr:MAG: YgcG family protein [Rugosibacter sp.]